MRLPVINCLENLDRMPVILDPRPFAFLTALSVMRKREEIWGREWDVGHLATAQ